MGKGYAPYASGRESRPGAWRRVLDRLTDGKVDYNHDGFATAERAEAAATALRAAGIPATTTATATGPVLLVKGRFRRQAELVIAPFQSAE